MIGYIKGTVSYMGENYVLLDNHGIGYRIFISAGYTDSGLRVGDEVRLYTYLSVREDALTLFGFLSQDDLEMFRMMLNVSGLGPEGALGILSVLSADDLRFAVLSDDAKAIAKAPGVGQKTAQKREGDCEGSRRRPENSAEADFGAEGQAKAGGRL